MDERDRVTLQQILDYAVEAVELLGSGSVEDILKDRKLELSLIRLAEVVGEAATRLSPDVRKQIPQIPWQSAIGMRNRLIHAYDAVDLDVLWVTIRSDFPIVIKELEAAIRKLT